MLKKTNLSRRSLVFIFFLYGFTLTILQIVYLRFFISIFYGNELTIGLFWFSWMLWTALGSYFFGRIKKVLEYLPSHHFLFGLVIPFTLLLMLFIRSRFLPVGSALPDFSTTIFTALVSLFLFGLLSGGLFPLYARLLNINTGQEIDTAGGQVYLWETAGSLVGGLLSGLVLIHFFHSTQIVVKVAILQFLLSFYFLSRTEKPRKSLIISIYFLIGFFALSSFLSSYHKRFNQLWKGMEIVEERSSPYSELVLTRLDHSFTLYQDGVPLFTIPDPQTAEETVHYALLLHDQPQTVLLIGGGFSGALFEILKHPSVRVLHYVELDPEVIGIYKEFFPDNWRRLITDERVAIHQTDGRNFLQHTRERFDLIITALPDPYTLQLNRFYSREFFALCKSRLNSGGILAFQASASENYLNDAQKRYLKAIEQSFVPLFKNWGFLPGEKMQFFLIKDAHPPVVNSDSLIKRLRERQLETLFVQDYYIPFKLMPDRIRLFREAFEETQFPFYNSDYRPLAYYFDTILWAGKTSRILSGFLTRMFSVSFDGFLLIFFSPIFLGLGLSFFLRKRPLQSLAATSGIFSIGFSVISLELLILLAFQVAHGYLYQQVAIFIALFMGGMAMGSYFSIRYSSTIYESLQKLAIFVLAGVSLLSFLIGALLPFIGAMSHSQATFYFLAVVSGFSGGFSFPLFNRLYLSHKKDTSKSGIIYAWDLVGSLAGSILCSIILIPIYGLKLTGVFLGILNLVIGLFMAAVYWVKSDCVAGGG
ncbi:fused MFS/spermidine synthase [Caldithrix abyssi]